MATSNQPGKAPVPGWYVHPHTGQPAWWTGTGWTVAPPSPEAAPRSASPGAASPQTPAPVAVGAASQFGAPSTATGGGMNQFGYPSGGSSYPAPTRSTGSTQPGARSSVGGGTNLGTWLVAAVIAIALVGGGLLVFRGLGKTAQAGAQTAEHAIGQAQDTDVTQALINASQAMQTWYADHQNFAIKGPVVGISTQSHVQYWASATGYCLRAYSAVGSAQGPANGSYYWYDSDGGGIQPVAGPKPDVTAGGACASATHFTALN